MTREEEIKKQAEKKALEPSRLMHPYAKQYKVMSAYEIGYIEGAVWADEHPHWISVKEKLPKEGEYVATINTVGVKDVRYYSSGKWYSNYGNEYGDITHWLPMPQAPKKGGKQ